MADNSDDLIVIKKKKVVAGGHHGGAWKVAYADFVTAMMSLFIVLWLLSSSNEQVKKSVAGYFNDPKGTAKLQGSSMDGVGHAAPISEADMPKLKEKLLASAQKLPNFDKLKKQVEITASPDGLRIELMEKEGGTFFDTGDAHPTPELEQFLALIGGELGKMPNRISIEGHTDAHPYSSPEGYSNWELSSDRANAARRLLQAHGLGCGAGSAGAGVCRPDAAQAGGADGCVEPADHDYCGCDSGGGAGSGGSGSGRGGGGEVGWGEGGVRTEL